MPYRQWKANIPSRNREIVDRDGKTTGRRVGLTAMGETLADGQAGWVTDPIDLAYAMIPSVPRTPRYATREQHGPQNVKLRLLIDDFRASAANAIVETDDTNIPDSWGVFVVVASYYKLLTPWCKLMGATLDFAHAYKHATIQEDQLNRPPPLTPCAVDRSLV